MVPQSYAKYLHIRIANDLVGSNVMYFPFQNINYVRLIEELVHELKAYGKLTNLIPITTAKVPIVKFTYPKSKVDCDISLYNTLAQRNTHMLRTYANIDSRVQVKSFFYFYYNLMLIIIAFQALGYTMKRFAKLCDICDASRGSLSSYAYILMVLYFLQQLDPPVLPVLQQVSQSAKIKWECHYTRMRYVIKKSYSCITIYIKLTVKCINLCITLGPSKLPNLQLVEVKNDLLYAPHHKNCLL
jgi:hypothetical protein